MEGKSWGPTNRVSSHIWKGLEWVCIPPGNNCQVIGRRRIQGCRAQKWTVGWYYQRQTLSEGGGRGRGGVQDTVGI